MDLPVEAEKPIRKIEERERREGKNARATKGEQRQSFRSFIADGSL